MRAFFYDLLDDGNDVVHRKPEIFEHVFVGRRFAEAIQPDDRPACAHVLPPEIRNARFDGDARRPFRQYGPTCISALAGRTPSSTASTPLAPRYPVRQAPSCAWPQGRLRSQLRSAPPAPSRTAHGFADDVRAAPDRGCINVARDERQRLPREQQTAWAVRALDRGSPRDQRLDRIGRPPHIHVLGSDEA